MSRTIAANAELEREAAEVTARLSVLSKNLHSDILIACRPIKLGDELALTPTEAAGFVDVVPAVRRASGAARIAARGLLSRLNATTTEIPRTASRAPLWPPGIVGSIAHDPELAVVAASRSLRSLGIDIEPAVPLPCELLDLFATPSERRALDDDLIRARLLFCVKEAVYKATYPLDGVFLEHHDVEADLEALTAVTQTGWKLKLQTMRAPRLAALAVPCDGLHTLPL